MNLPMDPCEVVRFVVTGIIEPETMERLFDHYTTNGEMPYGVAKARTGDPDQWIANRIAQEIFN